MIDLSELSDELVRMRSSGEITEYKAMEIFNKAVDESRCYRYIRK